MAQAKWTSQQTMNDYSHYYATNTDALEYQIKITLYTLAIYGCYGGYVSGTINVWWMAALTSVLVTRWMIAFHELLHLRSADELDIFSRLLPLPFAPLNIGYREYRRIHAGHHAHTASEEDPDAFHILGGHLASLFGAITLHEQQLVRYVKHHGLSGELSLMMVIRLGLFVTMLLIEPMAFFAWWLVLRLTYITNDFVFFHLVHYRAEQYGSFPIPLPAILQYPLILIYGIDVVYATMHHDIHHKQQQIAAKYLPRVAAGHQAPNAMPGNE